MYVFIAKYGATLSFISAIGFVILRICLLQNYSSGENVTDNC